MPDQVRHDSLERYKEKEAVHKIGIIQGRLSAPIEGKIQTFPSKTWREEFEKARSLGLNFIDWIFEDPIDANPLWSKTGRNEIREVIKRSGVTLDFVCADYFMQHPFFRVSDEEGAASIQVLEKLIPLCAEIGARGLEIPFLDNSRITSEEELRVTEKVLKQILPQSQKHSVAICLETSLEPESFSQLLADLEHSNLKVIYDSGNSSSQGFDPRAEISNYGKFIYNVHIKDRIRGGGTVPLGEGDTEFEAVFESLKQINYSGSFTLQVARGGDGNEVEWSKKNMDFVKQLISTYF